MAVPEMLCFVLSKGRGLVLTFSVEYLRCLLPKHHAYPETIFMCVIHTVALPPPARFVSLRLGFLTLTLARSFPPYSYVPESRSCGNRSLSDSLSNLAPLADSRPRDSKSKPSTGKSNGVQSPPTSPVRSPPTVAERTAQCIVLPRVVLLDCVRFSTSALASVGPPCVFQGSDLVGGRS